MVCYALFKLQVTCSGKVTSDRSFQQSVSDFQRPPSTRGTVTAGDQGRVEQRVNVQNPSTLCK